jgi:steroid 5-alpha reductase family enzyme
MEWISRMIFLNALFINLLFAYFGWLLSLKKNNVTHVDTMWSLFFVLNALYFYSVFPASLRSSLIILLVLFWGVRLAIYLTYRNWGKPEDTRYLKIRQDNEPHFRYKSAYIIFGFQAILAWIVGSILFIAIENNHPITWLDNLGFIVILFGIAYESIADYQLMQFKNDIKNRGKLLQSGLWKLSRHPNYFGEILVWWGFFITTLTTGFHYNLIAPLLMTFLILRFSGVTLLEANLTSKFDEYDNYQKKVNTIVPRFWKI